MGTAAFRRTATAAVLLVGLLTACIGLGIGGVRGVTWVDDLAELVAAAAGAVACFVVPRKARVDERRVWFAMGAGLAAWAIGEAIWSVYELGLGRETPFPSVADAGFLLFPVGAGVALWLQPWAATAVRSRLRELLDGLLVAASLFLVSWSIALGPVYRAGADSTLGFIIGLAYPASDVAMATLVILAVSRVSRRARPILLLLSAGLLAMAIGDSSFAYLTATSSYASNLLDVAWVVAFALIGLAACLPSPVREGREDEAASRWLLTLPYVPLLLGVSIIGYRVLTGTPLDNVEMLGGSALFALVLLRQFVTLTENSRLAVAVRSREEELRWRAFHDPLTGLANRALFHDRVAHAVEMHLRTARPLAVVYLDLDDFKLINDEFGHAAGDQVLTAVAERLRGVVRRSDTLARLGGDEFALLVEDQQGAGEAFAHRALEVLAEPFVVEGRQLPMQVSLGVADAVHAFAWVEHPSSDVLLAAADTAMYDAKRRGKGRVGHFSPQMATGSADELTLRADLSAAISAQLLDVEYQPIVQLDTGRVVGVEALARWHHIDHGQVSPERFIALAQRSGLVAEIDRFVLDRACGQLRRWHDNGIGTDLYLAVNLSPSHLADPALVDRVAQALTRHRIPPELLVLEVTEAGLTGNTDLAVAVLHRLRELGVRIAVDDFGTGFSSLSRLHRFPVDVLKIDRSFVTDIDGDGAALVAIVVQIGRMLGVETVAEGVEDVRQAEALAELGCLLAQGYLFSRPVAATDVPALLAGPGGLGPLRAMRSAQVS